MKSYYLSLLLAAGLSFAAAQPAAVLRPPATPLVAHDPYFSIWSMSDNLTDQPTKHWTGADQNLTGLVRVDDKAYRFMGAGPRNAEAMHQTSRRVLPTRTIYEFEGGGVRLAVTFLTPAFPEDLDILSRPVSYLAVDARSADGGAHDVAVYVDAAAHIATNTPEQDMQVGRFHVGGLDVLRAGTTEQPMLKKSGDNLRIDWGFLYVAAPRQAGTSMAISQPRAAEQFTKDGTIPDSDELETLIYPARANRPRLIVRFDLGRVNASPSRRHVLLGYDDLYSIQYFERNLRPWWRRNGMGAAELLQRAEADYESIARRAESFDEELTSRLRNAGGEKYAQIATLAFRQTLAAHKLVADIDGSPIYMSKENFSNGSIDTVDITYPSSPFFLYFNPALLKAQITPILDYASMPRWRWSYAPHDLGTYPLANGQTYGGGERSEENQMPVEESGNMLIMIAALAQKENSPALAVKYWPVLTKWAQFLREKGLDPENQLCTDDFAGHLAHNTNLSIKAIEALGSYGLLARMAGKNSEAAEYSNLAKQMAQQWVKMADDGDHYRLAFDKPGTWSQKYNLVWDRILSLNLFPPDVARKEIAFYRTKVNRYGLPLDNRETYTKLDWILWTATMTENKADWNTLVDPVYAFLEESPSRVPMTDWYWTLDAKQRGFQARAVVGGVFIRMLVK